MFASFPKKYVPLLSLSMFCFPLYNFPFSALGFSWIKSLFFSLVNIIPQLLKISIPPLFTRWVLNLLRVNTRICIHWRWTRKAFLIYLNSNNKDNENQQMQQGKQQQQAIPMNPHQLFLLWKVRTFCMYVGTTLRTHFCAGVRSFFYNSNNNNKYGNDKTHKWMNTMLLLVLLLEKFLYLVLVTVLF